MTKKRIVHYINQFYAGIGGEEMAGEVKPEAREGVVGPGSSAATATMPSTWMRPTRKSSSSSPASSPTR